MNVSDFYVEKESVDIISPSRIFSFSLRKYFKLQAVLWRFNISSIVLHAGVVALLVLTFKLPSIFPSSSSAILAIGGLSSIATFYFLFAIWEPFAFYIRFKILSENAQTLTFRQISAMLKEVLHNCSLLKHYAWFSLGFLRSQFTYRVAFLGSGIKGMFSRYERPQEYIFPFFHENYIPFYLIEGRNPMFVVFNLPFIAIFLFLFFTIISPGGFYGTALILGLFIFFTVIGVLFLSSVAFVYHFYAYKLFWRKYLRAAGE